MIQNNTIPLIPELDRYTIIQKIGMGGMATVYLARDTKLNRDVALKMMHEHLINSPESIKRFASEACAVAAIDHENVLQVYDFGEVNSRPYIVMEYIPGITLQALLDQKGILPNLVAIEICLQILSGLACTHAKGIIHRDIKPENIMIDPTGTVKIMDFGIAYVINKESLTLTGTFIGSPRFISPEQALGNQVTGKSDVFSVGVLLYAVLAGKPPFNGEVIAGVIHSIIHDTPAPLCTKKTAVLFWLSDFVDLCLVKDPACRPDAQAAIDLIEKRCSEHGLETKSHRLRQFLEGSGSYGDLELRHLFEHYKLRSKNAYKKRKISIALKSLEQAKAFGDLSQSDTNIIGFYKSRHHVKRYFLIIAIAIACLFGIWGLFSVFRSDSSGSLKKAEPMDFLKEDSHTGEKYTRESIDSIPIANVQPSIAHSENHVPQEKLHVTQVYETKQTPTLAASVEKEVTGFIRIQTNPPWAMVSIDNIERGITPTISLFKVAQGIHAIEIRKSGFVDYDTIITLSGSDSAALRVQLTPSLADSN